jgi:tetratricopeptide (TPR) repeat protein
MALSKDPKFALSHFNKGITYALDKKLDEAIASFSAAIAINGNYDAALAQRGKVEIAKGDIAAARGDFAKALALNPHNGTAIVGVQALQVAKALDTLATQKN